MLGKVRQRSLVGWLQERTQITRQIESLEIMDVSARSSKLELLMLVSQRIKDEILA
jgi:hypothetical protein